jgi:hypothetical protein
MASSLERRLRTLFAADWVRGHALVSAIFVVTRAAIHRAGLRFNFDISWMFLSDPGDLRDRLLDMLVYGHAYPPGMNLMTGLFLKTGAAAWLAHAAFQTFGLVLVNSLFYLLRVAGVPYAAAIATAFTLIPQSIYFEHLYLWTCPVAALLCLAMALFHRATARGSWLAWLGFFALGAALGWLRSTFHLVWFAAMVAIALASSEAAARRRVLAAAAVPAAFLLALYLKNLAVFGVFGAGTSGPANLTTITVRRLPENVRDEWMHEAKLSPFAAISPYAGPRAYLPFFGASDNPKWPPSMNALERPSTLAPNYNHWFFLEVNPKRRKDALHCLRHRPFEYAASVIENTKRMFQPSTQWHPGDRTPSSPHHQHREVLGGYESLYNTVVHGFPFAPVGLYALLPFAIVWAARRGHALARGEDRDQMALGWLFGMCLVQIGFVIAASVLFTFAETSRYRYEVEPLIWVIGAASIASLLRRLIRGTLPARCSRSESPITS